jgi:hypothetical protein
VLISLDLTLMGAISELTNGDLAVVHPILLCIVGITIRPSLHYMKCLE